MRRGLVGVSPEDSDAEGFKKPSKGAIFLIFVAAPSLSFLHIQYMEGYMDG